MPWIFLILLYLAQLQNFIWAKTITIDDADASITYSDGWIKDSDCRDCQARPSKAQTHGGTWHDATAKVGLAPPYFQLDFNGTSIELKHIVVEIVDPGFTTETNVVIYIDGLRLNTGSVFPRRPANTNTYLYGMQLWKADNLENKEHTLRVDLVTPSLLLLDSIIVEQPDEPTQDSSTSKPSKSRNIIPIVTGVLASVVVLAGVIVALLCIMRRRRRRGVQVLQSDPLRLSQYSQPPGPSKLESGRPPPSYQTSSTPSIQLRRELDLAEPPMAQVPVINTPSNPTMSTRSVSSSGDRSQPATIPINTSFTSLPIPSLVQTPGASTVWDRDTIVGLPNGRGRGGDRLRSVRRDTVMTPTTAITAPPAYGAFSPR